MQYKTVLLFGPPGSGKGTQGKILGASPGYYHCACGDVFRSLDKSSPMGILFAQYSSGGGLVPDSFTIDLWRQTIEYRALTGQFDAVNTTLLLDGIPRTTEQARLLAPDLDVMAVIYLVCNNVSEIVNRLRRRALAEGRADDTNEEVIRHRLDVYEEVTRPVLEFYPRGQIFRINASRPAEEVTAEMLRILQYLKAPKTVQPLADEW